jgi:adenosine deaminase CECR1
MSIEAYKAKRERLINDDRSFRRENVWKSQRSAAEISADECIRNLRAYEASTIWKIESDSIPHPFPGMEFLNGITFSELLYYAI